MGKDLLFDVDNYHTIGGDAVNHYQIQDSGLTALKGAAHKHEQKAQNAQTADGRLTALVIMPALGSTAGSVSCESAMGRD